MDRCEGSLHILHGESYSEALDRLRKKRDKEEIHAYRVDERVNAIGKN